ncbi:MAG: hypothetical protein ABJN84_11015 [Flavobacteriaceae bacterium]
MRKIILTLIVVGSCIGLMAQSQESLTLEKTDNSSASLNFKNPIGFWHISGPRTYENDNNFSVFWNNGDYKRYFTILDNGNVGIGTSIPTYKLDIAGTVKVGNGDWGAFIIDGKDKNDWLLNSHNSGNVFGIRTQRDNGEADWSFQVMTFERSTGNVGIGTSNPDMKLTVKGNIHAEEVKIDLNVPAPDYVFKEDYNLRSIEDVENFIKENNHLPEIPSAKEFEENGVMQAEMDMNLLKKIEELTLYTIQQEKKIKKLERENQKLKSLSNRLSEIEKLLMQENN